MNRHPRFAAGNPVLGSCHYVADRARFVSIDGSAIRRLADKLGARRPRVPSWHAPFHYRTRDERRMLEYVLVLDTLNYCFWSRGERWSIRERGSTVNGYRALAICVKRYFQKHADEPTLLPRFAAMTMPQLRSLLLGGRNLLLMPQRLAGLRAVCGVVMRGYDGDVRNFVRSADGDAIRLLHRISAELPTYDDCVRYRGRIVPIYKRAQILVCDIAGALDRRGFGNLRRLDELTAFADYKLPQILRHWGVMKYSPSLARRVDALRPIRHGSAEEVEIRAATVWTVELLRRALARRRVRLASWQLDWWLWYRSQTERIGQPYHRTLTIFY